MGKQNLYCLLGCSHPGACQQWLRHLAASGTSEWSAGSEAAMAWKTRGCKRQIDARLSSLAVQLLAITWEGEERLWSNPALKASPRLTPRGSLITPPNAWISVRTNQRQSGNRSMARHSFVCEANTRQVLSTKSMFDLLMLVCRSGRCALLWQFSHLRQKLWKIELLGAIAFVFFFLCGKKLVWGKVYSRSQQKWIISTKWDVFAGSFL